MLTDRYGWRMSEMAHEDPEYLEELLIHLRAENDVRAAQRKKKEARDKALARKAQQGARKGLTTEDADLSEIT
jgi:hypothetical protein